MRTGSVLTRVKPATAPAAGAPAVERGVVTAGAVVARGLGATRVMDALSTDGTVARAVAGNTATGRVAVLSDARTG
jgi:hypothetical protein